MEFENESLVLWLVVCVCVRILVYLKLIYIGGKDVGKWGVIYGYGLEWRVGTGMS